MKTITKRLPTRFARPTRFTVTPVVLTRAERDARLAALKERLAQQYAAAPEHAALRSGIERALNDAASLAWATPFPLLVLPTLADEKVSAIRRQAGRQAEIFRRSAAFLAQAA